MKISVIICTHNPRPDYLRRVLDALQGQTLPKDQWELLLVDNNSKEKLADKWNLSWQPSGRHVLEEELGLTPARLRGINEAAGELLLFVDDDNVLDPNYLMVCAQISIDFPFLGVWGGQQTGEFEIAVPDFLRPFLNNLACRSIDKAVWANLPFCYDATPVGAGMCVRKKIAMMYLNITNSNSLAKTLGRVGNQLTSCEDHDLAFTACDYGLGMGVFPTLRLVHLIPKVRLNKNYILRLLEGDAYSSAMLMHRRGLPEKNAPKISFRGRVYRIFRRLRGKSFEIQVEDARNRGLKKAINKIQETAI